jgi:hypothetical protein
MNTSDYGRVGIVVGGEYDSFRVWEFAYVDRGEPLRQSGWEVRLAAPPGFHGSSEFVPDAEWDNVFPTSSEAEEFLGRFSMRWLDGDEALSELRGTFRVDEVTAGPPSRMGSLLGGLKRFGDQIRNRP